MCASLKEEGLPRATQVERRLLFYLRANAIVPCQVFPHQFTLHYLDLYNV